MNWKSFMASAWTLPSLLAMTCLLVACQSIPKTLIGGTDSAAKASSSIAADVCRAWHPVTYSSRDTDQTKVDARANNAARDSYCGKKESR